MKSNPKNPITKVIFTPQNSTFTSSYVSYTKNKRYSNPNDTNLIAIVEAKHESHVQTTVVCAKSNAIQIRIRSGGHDYEELFLGAMPQITKGANKTIVVKFIAKFLGSSKKLMGIINKNLPELGLKGEDCYEMSWLNTMTFWADYPVGTSTSVLLKRPSTPPGAFFKSKSDYVKKPIPKEVMEKMWKTMLKFNNHVFMQWNPYGGVMDKIAANATAFPHRKGNLFKIQYFALWIDANATKANLALMKELYGVAETYVSSNPREAFLNYRDIDVGSNPSGVTNVAEGKIYGSKYFVGNLNRLMNVKAKYDPDNFFRHEQSIPPLHAITILLFFTTIFLLLSLPHSVSANQSNHTVIHTPNDSSFSSVLSLTIQNPRFSSPGTPKPVLILTPVQPSHVQSAVKCARRFGIHIRTRSGGHDYEGLSYATHKPFVILDLTNLWSITVAVDNRSVWVQTGATIGELYYELGKMNKTLAFPAGVCPTVGVGGHFSGGGYDTLLRKHGLAADHVIDARVVDARVR
ncbi:hypothetical protein HID58_041242, partial [Brassica napus]